MLTPTVSFLEYVPPVESFYMQETAELQGFSVPQRAYLYIYANDLDSDLPFESSGEYRDFIPRSVALHLLASSLYLDFQDILNTSPDDKIRAELRQERLHYLSGQSGRGDQELLQWEREEAAWQARLERQTHTPVQQSITEESPTEDDFFTDTYPEDGQTTTDFFAADNDNYLNPPDWIDEDIPHDEYDEILQSAVPDVYDEKHLEELNPEQRAAAEQQEGFALVVAGPGTGKTKTLVSHVVHLVKNGIPPRRIGLVTFTNKAAKEMRERAETMYPPANRVWCGTFHSLAFKLLREYNSKLGILTDREMRPALLSHALNLYGEAGKELKDMLFDAPSRLKQFHELDTEDRPDLLREWRTSALSKLTEIEQEPFLQVWREYAQALEKISSTFVDWKLSHHKLEFDDLVPAASKMIQKGEIFGLEEKISFEHFNLFDHLCVDEYQDTSSDQSELVSLLTRKMSNLFIVGDDAQSIYEWRNASADYMLDMAREHPDRVFRLETNYRSTATIVDQVNLSLKSISHRIDKTLRPALENDVPMRGQGVLYRPTTFASSDSQGLFLADAVQQHIQNGGKATDWAFLFRTHKRGGSIDLQHHLRRLNIPFVVVGGSPVHKEFPAVQMLSYMQLALNIHDELALKTLLQELPGVAELTAGKITRGFFKWLKAQERDGQIPRAALFASWMLSADGQKTIPVRAQKSPYFSVMHDTFSLIDYENAKTIMDITDRWCRLIMEDLQEKQLKKKNDSSTNENIIKEVRLQLDSIKDEMMTTGACFDVRTFIDNVLMNERQQRDAQEEKDVVTLSTVHSAKGLEWPMVCCPDMNEGTFPSGRWREAVQRRLRKELRNGVFKNQPGMEQELRLIISCLKNMGKESSENFFFVVNNSTSASIPAPEKFFIQPHTMQSFSELYTLSGGEQFSFGSPRQIVKLIKILERLKRQSPSEEETAAVLAACQKVNQLAAVTDKVTPIQPGSIESMCQPLFTVLQPVVRDVSFSPPMRMFLEQQFEKMLDEERRLFYVAISRAKDVLLLTRPGTINIPGEGYREIKESCYLNVLQSRDAPEYPTFAPLRKKMGEAEYVSPFDPSSLFDAPLSNVNEIFNDLSVQASSDVQVSIDEKELFGLAARPRRQS